MSRNNEKIRDAVILEEKIPLDILTWLDHLFIILLMGSHSELFSQLGNHNKLSLLLLPSLLMKFPDN